MTERYFKKQKDNEQSFLSMSEGLKTPVDERASLYGYSLCINISYSSQTDNVVLCSQGQVGHSLPQAITTRTHFTDSA